jgi:hypothetical protein
MASGFPSLQIDVQENNRLYGAIGVSADGRRHGGSVIQVEKPRPGY